MSHIHTKFTNTFMQQLLCELLEQLNLSQEQLAELMRISPRDCSDKKNGKSGFSASTSICLLAFLPSDKSLIILERYHDEVLEVERNEPLISHSHEPFS